MFMKPADPPACTQHIREFAAVDLQIKGDQILRILWDWVVVRWLQSSEIRDADEAGLSPRSAEYSETLLVPSAPFAFHHDRRDQN
jgi:hypothetical protein